MQRRNHIAKQPSHTVEIGGIDSPEEIFAKLEPKNPMVAQALGDPKCVIRESQRIDFKIARTPNPGREIRATMEIERRDGRHATWKFKYTRRRNPPARWKSYPKRCSYALARCGRFRANGVRVWQVVTILQTWVVTFFLRGGFLITPDSAGSMAQHDNRHIE
jgi:hypothetical protein